MPRLGWVGILAVLLFFASSVCAVTYNASRIELKDGTVYTDVYFTKDNYFKVIKINSNGIDQTVSFGNIELILDKKGKDVSREVLGKYYLPVVSETEQQEQAGQPPESSSRFDPSELESVRKTGQARHIKRWSVRLAVYPDFSLPIGDFYEGSTSGVGYGTELSVRLTRDIAIRGMVSRAGIKSEDLVGSYYDRMLVVEDNSSTTTWRFAAAVEYHTWPKYSRGGKLLYSIYSGMGAIRHSGSGSMLLYNLADDGYYVAVPSDPITKFMIVTGGGVTVALSPNFGINFGVDIYMITVGRYAAEDRYNSIATAYNFDLKLGLVLIG